jgi:hypothetical protein
MCFMFCDFFHKLLSPQLNSCGNVQVQIICLPLVYVFPKVWERSVQHNLMLEEFINDLLHQTSLHAYYIAVSVFS